MKALYVVAVAVIGLLTLAAFNPEDVARMTRDAKHRLVDEPRERAEFEALVARAESGEANALYRVGLTLVGNNAHWSNVTKEVLARFSLADGERMLREAAM